MKECIYCGENPVPHLSLWLYNSLDVLFTPFEIKSANTAFGKSLDWLASQAGLGLLWGLDKAGLIKYNVDPLQVPFARGKNLFETAIAKGIKIKEIKPFNRSIDLYEAVINNQKQIFVSLPKPKNFDSSSLIWLDDKWLFKQHLLKHNLPVPQGGACTSFAKALKIFETINKPAVVKPRRGSRGRHTTTFIYTKDELKKAFRVAKTLCHWVVIEEQLFGPVFRATLINGQVVGVLGGSPAQITGDGQKSIKQLIEEKNQTRNQRVNGVKINQKSVELLNRQNLSLDSVLAQGQTIDLSEKLGLANGGTSFDASDELHAKTKMTLKQAARSINNPILGLDFIIADISKDPDSQTWGIIECNAAPFVNLHLNPLFGKSKNIALNVWDLILKSDSPSPLGEGGANRRERLS